MSSLFQGLVTDSGEVKSTLEDPDENSFIFRGIALRADGAVHMSIGAVIEYYVGGVPVSANGVVCINDTLTTPVETLPGALRLATGRLYTTPIDAPNLIHQGVGLRTGGRMCRVDAPSVGDIVPDNLWTIEDPTSCSIFNNVITWNRVTNDSLIRLDRPASYAPGQTWVVSYTVVNNDGQNTWLFCSSTSSINKSGVYPTSLGDQYEEGVGTDDSFLLRWTPNVSFNGKNLVIRDVRVYDRDNPGAYP